MEYIVVPLIFVAMWLLFMYELFFAPSVLDGLPDPSLGMEKSDKKKETIEKG
jgi:hypothetical protein